MKKVNPKKKITTPQKITTPPEPYEDFYDRMGEDGDILCTCDDDPDFCELHKDKICTCDENPDYCPVHNTWI